MKTSRIVLFFLVAFGSILLPFAVVTPVAILTWTPEFMVDRNLITESFSVRSYSDPVAARAALTEIVETIPRRTTVTVPGSVRFTRSDSGNHGVLLQVQEFVIYREAADRETLDRDLAALPFLVPQEPGLMNRVVNDHLLWLVAGIGGYILLLIPLWLHLAGWAARIEAESGVAPVPEAALRARILAVQTPHTPLAVSPGKGPKDLVVTWKYADHRWATDMHAAGMTATAQLYLRLDERRHCVYAQDRATSVTWRTGVAGGVHASVKLGFFRGIAFGGYSSGAGLDLLADKTYTYRFTQQELRSPVVHQIINAGWDYRPKAILPRVSES